MTYPEMAATVLTGVAVLVTVLGVFIAVISIWGYAQIQSNARSAATKFVESQLYDGKLRTEIENLVTKHLNESLSNESFRELLRQRVDRLLYSDAQSRMDEKLGKQTPNQNKEYGE